MAAGTNWNRPIRPRSSVLSVRAYICQPNATPCIWNAIMLATRETHSSRTGGWRSTENGGFNSVAPSWPAIHRGDHARGKGLGAERAAEIAGAVGGDRDGRVDRPGDAL